MMISRNWLQDFFEQPLPDVQALAEALTFHAFEIDDIKKVGDDDVLDVKVLPNRPDAFSHRGIARELSAILSVPLKADPLREGKRLDPRTSVATVTIADPERCSRYVGAVMRNVKIGPSPEWLVKRLEAVGERSINNVVDVTNYVMLMLGQPLHAFDLAKITGAQVGVRAAREGEVITILGGTDYTLSPVCSVIVDGADRPLAIAGIKGGSAAEITAETTDIFIEGATFDPVFTRRAAKAINLRTGASARFEHGLPPELPAYAVQEAVRLIIGLAGDDLDGYVEAGESRRPRHYAGVSVREVNDLLGTSYTEDAIADVFAHLGMEHMFTDPLEQIAAQSREYVGTPMEEKTALAHDAADTVTCGFVCDLHARAGVSIPTAVLDQIVYGEPIERADVQPGDVVYSRVGVAPAEPQKTHTFARGTPVPVYADHLGICLEEGLVAHMSLEQKRVVIESLDESPEFATIVGFRRMASLNEQRLVVEAPFERDDIRQSADLIEEIARIRGLDTIVPRQLPPTSLVAQRDPGFAAAEAARTALTNLGFIELYTYSLTDEGTVAPANSLVRGRDHMRSNLTRGVTRALDKNAAHMPLLGMNDMRVFEVGNVFTPGSEALHVCVAARVPGKKGTARAIELVEEALSAVAAALGIERSQLPAAAETVECDLTALVSHATPRVETSPRVAHGTTMAPISAYPFVLRDIAAWMPADTSAAEVTTLIRTHGTPLLVRVDQFDEFTKDNRTSRAYHLVFQSFAKTLTDAEINLIMESITSAFTQQGWEVR